MKKINWLTFMFLAITFFACKDDETIDETAPAIQIISPPAGSTFAIGEEIDLKAVITDNTTVSQVLVTIPGLDAFTEFGVNPNLSSYDLNYPIEITEEYQPGDYTITIMAQDQEANTSTETIEVTIVDVDTPEPTEEAITATGFEDGFNTLGEVGEAASTAVTYIFVGEEGIDSVNVIARTAGGVETFRQAYDQAWFDAQGIDNAGDFTFEDHVRFPNVAAAEGETTFTINTFREGQQVGEREFTTFVGPAAGARRVNLNVSPPAGLPQGARIYISGDFQPSPFATNDPAYELTRSDDEGPYHITLFTTGDMNYSYVLVDEDGNIISEVDEDCIEVQEGTGSRTYVFAERDVAAGEEDTIEEEVNFVGFGGC